MKNYKVKLPSYFYVLDFYADNEPDARAQVRDFLNVKRLPAYTEVWQDRGNDRALRENRREFASAYRRAGQIFD